MYIFIFIQKKIKRAKSGLICSKPSYRLFKTHCFAVFFRVRPGRARYSHRRARLTALVCIVTCIGLISIVFKVRKNISLIKCLKTQENWKSQNSLDIRPLILFVYQSSNHFKPKFLQDLFGSMAIGNQRGQGMDRLSSELRVSKHLS